MKMKLIPVTALALFALLGHSNADVLKQTRAAPEVSIYYNPFNADSISLIKNQGKDGNGIYDLMLPNSNHLALTFVPWSNANTETKAYTCPDDDNNCLATRLHACAINLHKSDPDANNQIFHFIVCTMSSAIWKTNTTEAVVQCVNQIGEWIDDGEYLVECAEDTVQSDAYLAILKGQADKAVVTKVPWVTINGVRNKNAETDLKTELCNSIDGDKPATCGSSVIFSSILFFSIILFSTLSINYI